jgi:hypothetical protein
VFAWDAGSLKLADCVSGEGRFARLSGFIGQSGAPDQCSDSFSGA